jgi:hypothetical protein
MPVPRNAAARHPSRSHPPSPGVQPDPPLDRATLIARFAGDAGFFDEVAAIFLEDYPRMLGALRDACAARNLPGLRGAAHAFKGAVGHFTNGTPYLAVAALERLAEEGHPVAFDEAAGAERLLGEFVAAVAVAHAAQEAPPERAGPHER